MANYIFPNEVLENKIKSVLNTKVDMSKYITVDNSLAGQAGDTKQVVTRSVSGDVQTVAMGEGNTESIEVTGSTKDYVIETVQGNFVYYDEQVKKDPKVVDTGINGMVEKMTNNFNDKAVAEWNKGKLTQVFTTISFDNFADAISQLNLEEEGTLYGLINPKMVAALRKALKDDLKYIEGIVKTGYIGTVCGVNIITSKLIADNVVFIVDNSAVTQFLAKSIEIEQVRDANLRKNTVYARTVGVTALTDNDKVVRIAKAITKPTITTGVKATKSIAGACVGATVVEIYINDVLKGEAVVASDAYTFTALDNLVVGDTIIAKAYAPNKAMTASDEFTVVEE